MEKTWLFISVLFAFFHGALAAPCPLLRAPESAIKTGCYICVLHDDTSAEKFDEILQNAISYADGHKVYGSVQTVIKAFTLKLSAYSVARVSNLTVPTHLLMLALMLFRPEPQPEPTRLAIPRINAAKR